MEVSLHLKLLIPSTVQCFILSTPAFIKVIMTSQWFSQLHSAALTQLTTPSFLKFPPPLISGTLHHLVYLLLLSCVSSTLNGFSSFSHILHATISQDFSLPPSVGLPSHFNHSHQQPPLNLSFWMFSSASQICHVWGQILFFQLSVSHFFISINSISIMQFTNSSNFLV